MLEHIPRYQMPDGSIVHAGRVRVIQGPQVQISSAPITHQASKANGYRLVPVKVDMELRARVKPGDVLVITKGRLPQVHDPEIFPGKFIDAPEPVPG